VSLGSRIPSRVARTALHSNLKLESQTMVTLHATPGRGNTRFSKDKGTKIWVYLRLWFGGFFLLLAWFSSSLLNNKNTLPPPVEVRTNKVETKQEQAAPVDRQQPAQPEPSQNMMMSVLLSKSLLRMSGNGWQINSDPHAGGHKFEC
jgi:hypothetical protein